MNELSKLHHCEKCDGKIINITIDDMGLQRCSYCGEIVDYNTFIEKELSGENDE